jgi:hypothetical protein
MNRNGGQVECTDQSPNTLEPDKVGHTHRTNTTFTTHATTSACCRKDQHGNAVKNDQKLDGQQERSATRMKKTRPMIW